ncbi:3138_t:CDS:2 [Acaulospora morrowiae]|uniref:3138_t:CDS:1 n=1 Tax=Acaulospora morrowiae TaxID=94023 RepID=A0A9N8YT30_9GLOM|nr:3138_t:CDS:2 [Acaulospora morrowiae]
MEKSEACIQEIEPASEGRRDSRERDCDAEDCPKRDNLLLGSLAKETRCKEDEGRTKHSNQDLHTVEDETPAPKNDNHCDEEETLSNLRNRNKHLEETIDNNQSKILGRERANVETPAELLDETSRSACNETPMIIDDRTPRRKDEMPKTEIMDNHPSKTIEMGTDNKALATKYDAKGKDVNKITEPAGDETSMNKNSGLSNKGREGMKKMTSLEDVPSGDQGDLNERMYLEPQKEIVIVDNHTKEVDKVASTDEEAGGRKLTHARISVAYDAANQNDKTTDEQEKSERDAKKSQYEILGTDNTTLDLVDIENGNGKHDASPINSDASMKKEFEASRYKHTMREQWNKDDEASMTYLVENAPIKVLMYAPTK